MWWKPWFVHGTRFGQVNRIRSDAISAAPIQPRLIELIQKIISFAPRLICKCVSILRARSGIGFHCAYCPKSHNLNAGPINSHQINGRCGFCCRIELMLRFHLQQLLISEINRSIKHIRKLTFSLLIRENFVFLFAAYFACVHLSPYPSANACYANAII